ncbi:MAG: adenylate/guanylate cyclase domain-containing protein [Candidatus Binatia bacterium]
MHCASCGTELLPGKPFCHNCGAPVPQTCAQCGTVVEAGFRFCPGCGAPLADARLARLAQHIPAGLADKLRATRDLPAGERKQVTVLFCDLVGSTALAARLDPEEYHDRLEAYLERAVAEIYRLEGIVPHLAGDGFMALFGAPIAHEDAPQRAVRAALAIHAALEGLGQEPLRVRIGVNTGPVVVGTVGSDLRMEYTAIGDTTNLAQRLQTVAEPGTTLVSDTTARLVRGAFHLQPRGPFALKGITEPVTAHEVTGRTDARTPMALAVERGLTPFVGRTEELAQLLACHERLAGGLAQVVAVVGDAGSGKSRLVHEFRERLAGTPTQVLEGRCAALSQSVPYAPFVGMLRRHFALESGETGETVCSKVAAGLRSVEPALDAGYPFLCRLLSPGAPGSEELALEGLEEQTFAAVAHLVVGLARQAPIVMVVEDLHWIDPQSRRMLEDAVARLGNESVMLLVTHRRDYEATWRPASAFTQLRLRPLAEAHTRAIVRAVAGGPLPDDVEERILARAEGSPFFTEEITRALVEEGHEIPIPGTVQEVLAARLDRLSPAAKRVVQVAAVFGRQFRRPELEHVLTGEPIDVGQELDELLRRGILHRQNFLSLDEYRFGESLTQEVAYESLLLKHRRQLHDRVAAQLEEGIVDGDAARLVLLAHHRARGDDAASATAALLRAGRETEKVPSYGTAALLYRQAWEIADAALGAHPELTRAAVNASLEFCRVSVIYGSTEVDQVERAAARGRELARELADPEAVAYLTLYLGMATMGGDEDRFARGLALIEEALAVAQRAGREVAQIRIARGLASAYLMDGRFELARQTIGWVVAELARLGHAEKLTDLYLGARVVSDAIHYLSEDPNASLAAVRDTYEAAVRAGNRTVQSGSSGMLAGVYFMRGEYVEAQRWADLSLAIASAISTRNSLASIAGVALLSRFERGEPVSPQRYLDLIDEGLSAALGSTLYNYRFVCEAFLAVGDLGRAERFLERTHGRTGGRAIAAQTAEAAGQVLTRLGPDRWSEAARTFTRAISLAEAIGANSVLAAALIGDAELAAARGDLARSRAQLAHGSLVAAELGLAYYSRRADRLRAALEAGAAPMAETSPPAA